MSGSAVRSARRSGRRGLTLVELLAVIAIIALLVGLVLPAVQGAREAARRVQCGNNLKQLALAFSAYSSQLGHFPAAAEHRVNQCASGFSGGGLPLSFTDGRPAWSIRLLPFLEQQPLYDRFDFAQPFFGIICYNNTGCHIDNATTPAQRVNLPLQQTPVPGFMCPSHPAAGTPMKMWLESSGTIADCGGLRPMYHAISGGGPDSEAHCYSSPWAGSLLPPDRRNFFNNGIFAVNSRTTPAAIRDGLSNTLLLGEGEVPRDNLWSSGARGCDSCGEQGNTLAIQDPINTAYNEANDLRAASRRCLRSKHPGLALGAMADGSVHVFGDDMSVTVLQLLGKRADRQPVSWP